MSFLSLASSIGMLTIWFFGILSLRPQYGIGVSQENLMTGSIVATLGALCIVTALTLVRYRHVSGNSHVFAIFQAIGSGALAVSTIWQFNIGTLILEVYCVLINVHTIYLNIKRKRGKCDSSI